jgi:hypothetical protein
LHLRAHQLRHVGLTRHSKQASIFVDRKTARDAAELAAQMSRPEIKRAASHYIAEKGQHMARGIMHETPPNEPEPEWLKAAKEVFPNASVSRLEPGKEKGKDRPNGPEPEWVKWAKEVFPRMIKEQRPYPDGEVVNFKPAGTRAQERGAPAVTRLDPGKERGKDRGWTNVIQQQF